jgi:hypothetical protein
MMGYPCTMKAARLCSAIVVAALALALMSAGCAARQPRGPSVVVLEVKGAPDARWQERVEEVAAARRIDVIPADSYWVMARRLKAEPLTAPNVARVAATLGASAVVHGRVSGKRRHRVVTIYVRDGQSGRVIETHRVRLRRGVPAARGEAALERRLLASVGPSRSEPVEPVEPPGPPDVAPPARPAFEPAPRTARRDEAPARTAPARPAPAPAAVHRRADREAEPPPPAPPPVKYDQRGQAIDDEKPSTLK